jgi:predicted murein hydrolase (TIGR00659 family)
VNLQFAQAWTALVQSPLFGITLTLIAYQAARILWKRTRGHSLANPVLVASILVAATLLILRIPYDDYQIGAQYISFLLGPATVALALPLYRQAANIRRAAWPVVTCLITGSITAVIVAITVTKSLGGSDQLALSLAPKSTTTPVAIALSESVGGIASLTAAFTIATGILGAVVAPRLLTLLHVFDQRVRGLAIGMSSHGIGTSRALQEDAVAGAFSGLAMALNALVTAVVLPLLLATMPWMLNFSP